MFMRRKQNIHSVVLLLLVSILLIGCASETQYEVANYQGELAEGETKSDYDKNLFYRNDQKTKGADPAVLDNTAKDGYYYLYVTEGSVFCYRSLNMMDWEPVGHALDNFRYDEKGNVTDFRQATNANIWAPEVIYDSDTETYYMFFSAKPKEDTTVKSPFPGTVSYLLMVATSKCPDKGFTVVDFSNLHTYDTSKYPHYYAKFAYFDPEILAEKCVEDKVYTTERAGYLPAIDPHPYEDESGKYLFWTDQDNEDRTCAIKMQNDNWLTPDWSTFTVITCAGFSTVDKTETVKHDLVGGAGELINEGPQIIKHNGKFYLSYSTGAYADNSYQVAQAVAEPDENGGPLGSYRKLTEEEGGVLISGMVAGSTEVTGTGHHFILTMEDKQYILYHRHDDPLVGGGNRNHAIDEIKWITIKDKFGNDLDVMYANGPTYTAQPKIEKYSEYKNIAGEATVSVSSDAKVENLSSLTDGLLSIYKYGNESFMQYIKETEITQQATFKFDFDAVKEVHAIMVYNSKMHSSYFKNISEVKFICDEKGEEVIRYIDNIEFSTEYYQTIGLNGTPYYVMPGSAAYAEFEGLAVKSIEITVDVPEGQNHTGISEIKILGK